MAFRTDETRERADAYRDAISRASSVTAQLSGDAEGAAMALRKMSDAQKVSTEEMLRNASVALRGRLQQMRDEMLAGIGDAINRNASALAAAEARYKSINGLGINEQGVAKLFLSMRYLRNELHLTVEQALKVRSAVSDAMDIDAPAEDTARRLAETASYLSKLAEAGGPGAKALSDMSVAFSEWSAKFQENADAAKDNATALDRIRNGADAVGKAAEKATPALRGLAATDFDKMSDQLRRSRDEFGRTEAQILDLKRATGELSPLQHAIAAGYQQQIDALESYQDALKAGRAVEAAGHADRLRRMAAENAALGVSLATARVGLDGLAAAAVNAWARIVQVMRGQATLADVARGLLIDAKAAWDGFIGAGRRESSDRMEKQLQQIAANITAAKSAGGGGGDGFAKWLEEIDTTTAATKRLTEAHAQGAAALAKQTLAEEIDAQVKQHGKQHIAEITRALTEQAAAQRALELAKFTADTDRQGQATRRLTEAQYLGAAAVAEANIQNMVAAELAESGIGLMDDEAAAIERLIRGREKDLAAQRIAESWRAANDDLAIAQLENRLLLSGQSEGEIRRQIAHEEARRKVLADSNGVMTEQGEAVLALADRAYDLNEANRMLADGASDMATAYEDAFGRLGDVIAEAFDTGTISVEAFLDTAKAGLADVTASILKLSVANPLMNQLDGGNRGVVSSGWNTSLGSLGGGIGGASALGAGLSAANNPLGMISGLMTGSDAVANSWGNIAGFFGAGPQTQTAFMDAGQAFSSPLASIGSFAGNMLMNSLLGDRGIGASIGSTIGGIAGSFLAPILGPFGPILGSMGGNFLGGLFGNNEPVAHTGGSFVNLGTGRSVYSSDKASEETTKAMQGIDDVLTQVTAALGRAGYRSGVGSISYEIGDKYESQAWFDYDPSLPRDQQTAVATAAKGDAQALTGAILRAYFERLQGLPAEVSTALGRIDWQADLKQALEDVDFAFTFRSAMDQMASGMDPVKGALGQMETQARAAGQALTEQVEGFRADAVRLGLATEEELRGPLQTMLTAMLGLGEAATPMSAMDAAIRQMTLNLEAMRPAMEAAGWSTAQATALIAEAVAKNTATLQAQAESAAWVAEKNFTAGLMDALDQGHRLTGSDILASIGLDARALGSVRDQVNAVIAGLDGTAADIGEILGLWQTLTASQSLSAQHVDAIGEALKGVAQGLRQVANDNEEGKKDDFATTRSSWLADALADAESRVADARSRVIDQYKTERDRLNGLVDGYRSAGGSIRDAIKQLTQGDLGDLDAAGRRSAARAELEATYRRSMTGTDEERLAAQQSLPELARASLEASRAYYSTSAGYYKDLNEVRGWLEAAGVSADQQADATETQLQTLKDQVGWLASIDEGVTGVVAAMDGLTASVTALAALRSAAQQSGAYTLPGALPNTVAKGWGGFGFDDDTVRQVAAGLGVALDASDGKGGFGRALDEMGLRDDLERALAMLRYMEQPAPTSQARRSSDDDLKSLVAQQAETNRLLQQQLRTAVAASEEATAQAQRLQRELAEANRRAGMNSARAA